MSFQIEVRVNPIQNPTTSLVAMGDVILRSDEGTLVMKGWKVINGSKGLFATPPSVKGKDDKYSDLIISPSKEDTAFMDEIRRSLVSAYEAGTGGVPASKGASAPSSRPAGKSSVPDSYLAPRDSKPPFGKASKPAVAASEGWDSE